MENSLGKKIFRIFIILFLLIILTILYSKYLGVKGIQVKEYKVTDGKITDNFHGLKVIHMSDVLFGRTVNKKDLQKIISKINSIHPDLVVLTGDFFDKDIPLDRDEIKSITGSLERIESTIGKFAIKGDNDASSELWESVMRDSNFIDLNDNFEYLYKEDYTPIIISGISTNLELKKDLEEKTEAAQSEIVSFNENASKPVYSILLIHEPDYINKLDVSYYDLILAGHSLGGQIKIPGMQTFFLPKGAKKYYKDYQKVNNAKVYISSGIGTSSFDYRLFNKPSINLYRLTNK